MFATRKVTAGELILAERALMIAPAALQVPVPADIFDKYPAEQAKQAILFEQEKALEVAYKRMPEEHQTAFMTLYNSHTQDGSGPIVGVIRTNGYILDGPMQDECLCNNINRFIISINCLRRAARDEGGLRGCLQRTVPP